MPTPKIDWCFGLMVKKLSSREDAIGWKSLKKKKEEESSKCVIVTNEGWILE